MKTLEVAFPSNQQQCPWPESVCWAAPEIRQGQGFVDVLSLSVTVGMVIAVIVVFVSFWYCHVRHFLIVVVVVVVVVVILVVCWSILICSLFAVCCFERKKKKFHQ